MAYLKASAYREWEAQWREEAAKRPRGREQAACLALAEGYADLVRFLGRLSSADGASAPKSVTGSAAQPDRPPQTRQEGPRAVSLG
jgi:hypothetical protein